MKAAIGSNGGKYRNGTRYCQLLPVRKVDRLLSWILPFHCVLCGARAVGMDLCAACRQDLPWLSGVCGRCATPLRSAAECRVCSQRPPPTHACRVALAYEYPVDRLVSALKFHRQAYLSRVLGELLTLRLLGDAQRGQSDRVDFIVPVPLHRERCKQRGYNQAALIAATAGAALGLVCELDCLHRVRATQAQTGLNRAARQVNLRDAFAVTGARCSQVKGARIALVDDVITTGATTTACAETLLAAGAAVVEVWAVARALRAAQSEVARGLKKYS